MNNCFQFAYCMLSEMPYLTS